MKKKRLAISIDMDDAWVGFRKENSFLSEAFTNIFDLFKNEKYKPTLFVIGRDINIYKEYLKQATKTKDYLMSLDTLFFQLNLTKKDINNYSTLFNLFIYQMYGQYYKFYKKILHNLENVDKTELFKDLVYEKNFTSYTDLNFKEYSFDEIRSIHNLIVSIMTCISNYIEKQKYEIEDDDIRVNKGVSIDTLVFEKRRFNDILMNENRLFHSIMKKFYDYQKKIMFLY